MGPGSFGTGKQRVHPLRRPGELVASMGPGSFGTGKPGVRGTKRSGRDCGFNGARFFWNREVRGHPLECTPGELALQWGPVLLEPGRVPPDIEKMAWVAKMLQWGPVLLEPGSAAALPSIRSAKPTRFNGARFFWNREGTCVCVCAPNEDTMLQWGPVLLEPGRVGQTHPLSSRAPASMGPGSFGTGKGLAVRIYLYDSSESFNGARFFWNRED